MIYQSGALFPVSSAAPSIPLAPSAHENADEEFSFSAFAKTIRRVLTKYGDAILIKSPNFGSMELRTVIASYLARSRGIVVSPEQIIIGSGSEYMYSLIVQMLGRDRIYGLENPSYALLFCLR